MVPTRQVERVNLGKRTIAAIGPPATGYELHWDEELRGFGLRVTAGGVKSFFVEKRVKGRTVRLTLGKHDHSNTPEIARRKAQVWLGKVAQGLDPKAERARELLGATTLEQAFTDYLRLKRRSKDGLELKERTKADMRSSLARAFAHWKSKPVTAITRAMVEARYQQLAAVSIARANIDFRYLRAVINFAIARSVDAEGKPVITYNPVSGLKGQWKAVAPRKRVMSAEHLKKWLPAIRALPEVPEREAGKGRELPQLHYGDVFRDLWLFIALTGCRLSEALSLEPGDVDLKAGEVTFRDTKNRRDHTLPLTADLIEILTRRLEAKEPRIFPVTNYRYAIDRVRTACGFEWSAHDLRRLAATAMERAGVPVYTIKAVLNHLSGGQDVTGNYVQVDRAMKLAALEKIGAFVLGKTEGVQ